MVALKFNVLEESRMARAARNDGRSLDFWDQVIDAVRARQITFESATIPDLFEAFIVDRNGETGIGRDIFDRWRRGRNVDLKEEVSTKDFAMALRAFSTAIAISAWGEMEYIQDDLCTTKPANNFLDEKGFRPTNFGNDAIIVDELKPYPMVKVGESYVTIPKKQKRGGIVGVSKEMLMSFDGGLLRSAISGQSRICKISKEIRVIDCAIGATSTYRPNGLAAIATYGDNSGTHDWDNLAASNGLATPINVDNALQLLAAVTDPDTGLPSGSMGSTYIGPPALALTAARLFGATIFRYGDGASNTWASEGPNPIKGPKVISSQMFKSRTGSDTTWFWGDPKAAFSYYELWGITVVTDDGGDKNFEQDVVFRQKVSECGVAVAENPHRMVKNTA